MLSPGKSLSAAALLTLALAATGCGVSAARNFKQPNMQLDPARAVTPDPGRQENPEPEAGEGPLNNRFTLLLAYTEQDGEDDFTQGFEDERHLDEHWGIGGLVDFFEGEEDETLVAVSLIYHPIPPVGFSVSPGYAFISGEDDSLSVRLGMFYEFELGEAISIAPAIYTDFQEGGVRASILGVGLSYSF